MGAQEEVVSRLREELNGARWSTYTEFAKRMRAAGSSGMTADTISKIVKGDRRIHVDELYALGVVLECSVEELRLPRRVAANRRTTRVFKQYLDQLEAVARAVDELEKIWQRLLSLLAVGSASGLDQILAQLDAAAQTKINELYERELRNARWIVEMVQQHMQRLAARRALDVHNAKMREVDPDWVDLALHPGIPTSEGDRS